MHAVRQMTAPIKEAAMCISTNYLYRREEYRDYETVNQMEDDASSFWRLNSVRQGEMVYDSKSREIGGDFYLATANLINREYGRTE